jgi:hypothetical protein
MLIVLDIQGHELQCCLAPLVLHLCYIWLMDVSFLLCYTSATRGQRMSRFSCIAAVLHLVNGCRASAPPALHLRTRDLPPPVLHVCYSCSCMSRCSSVTPVF